MAISEGRERNDVMVQKNKKRTGLHAEKVGQVEGRCRQYIREASPFQYIYFCFLGRQKIVPQPTSEQQPDC